MRKAVFESRIFFLCLISCIIFIPDSYGFFDPCNEQVDPDALQHLASRSPYKFSQNLDDTLVQYSGCQPMKIFGIIRHGTRTPGSKFVNKLIRLLPQLKPAAAEPIPSNDCLPVSLFGTIQREDQNQNPTGGGWLFGKIANMFSTAPPKAKMMISPDAQKLKKTMDLWSSAEISDPDKLLVEEGEDELFQMAKRLKSRFPSALPNTFSNSTYIFKFSDSQRTRESARYFTIGLFGEEESNNVFFPEPLKQDPVLRFYKLCEKWQKTIKMNPKTAFQFERFRKSKEVHDMLTSVSDRLGLDYTISFETIYMIYVACGFETAWSGGSTDSSLCRTFTKQDAETIEYFEELKYYYIHGYGYDLNHQQACPLIQNAMNFFTDPTQTQKGIFYFTHSGTLVKSFSNIGLYKDDYRLTYNLDKIKRQSRKWRVSKMDSFGNNLVFVLFKCNDGDKILTLHNERPMAMTGCGNEPLCPLNIARKVMPSSSDRDCNFSKLCAMPEERSVDIDNK